VLLFKKRFLPAIRAGEKTQTVRLWPFRRMRSGQRSYIPGAGPIIIDSVDVVTLDELTDADACLDGLTDAPALRAEFARLYSAQLDQGWTTFRIRFHLAPPAPETPPAP
jgi:hypothetical protein